MSASALTIHDDYERRKRTGSRRDPMKFVSPFKTLLLLMLAATLTACGGGGGSGGDGGFTPTGIRATATASSGTIGVNSATDITVRVTTPNGTPVINGTTVSAVVTPAGIGNISAPTGGLTATTVGGNATFRFQSGTQTGTATINFTASEAGTSQTATATATITITGASTGDSRLTITPVRSSLPINAFNVDPFIGSPYMTEVVINVRTLSGQAVTQEDGLVVSLSPVGSTGGYTTLDDPTTTTINEFLVRRQSGPVDINAGRATVFVHSLNFSGTTVLTASFVDPETNQTVTQTFTFTINAVTPPLPTSIRLNPIGDIIYVTGSGGNTSGQIEAFVSDGIGQPVPDPVAGNARFNNVRFEIVGPDTGERLSGVNAAGQTVSGRSISVATVGGVAGVIFTAGTQTGNFVVRATTDRADNNVDNGIQDPVTADRTVIVSDGRLFSIEITSPVQNAIGVNPILVSPDVTVPPGQTPNDPNGTYSVTVSIIATDRQGNPVLPGTPIRFGLIDEPQVDTTGVFEISGPDGNPQEGGTLFTAPTGQFRTAGGGAGPGDTLVLFGKEVTGNRDHESARIIASIQSETSLTVQRRFNFNDDTGVSVNSGPVIPYIIGRAVTGNIGANAFTDENGVATTRMNYPVSAIGKRVVVWAQGDGDIVNGTPETVADVDILAFPGIADLLLTASPTTIPANGTYPVRLCVVDAIDSPIQGVRISFGFGGGITGSVDGVPGSGIVGTPTGADGCTIANVSTTGVPTGGGNVTFSVGASTAVVQIVRDALVLQARPSVITSGSQRVVLTLLNSAGVPQPGYQITGTCTGTNGTIVALSDGPGVTNANGETTVQITSTNLNQVGQAGGGSCTFRTVDGSATTTVQIIGEDLCETVFSPPPDGCPNSTTQFPLTLTLNGAGGGYTVSSNPTGITCAVPNGGAISCNGLFDEGDVLSLIAIDSVSGLQIPVNWTGQCAPFSGANPATVGTVTMSAARVCNVAR
jgi:hypothetical protein